MLILLNGYPGVGKLAIGQELIRLINGRLLDNHSVYGVAFALTEIKSDAFFRTIRAVQSIADERILALHPDVPIVLTDVLTEGSDWADECWRRVLDLATARGPLCVVHLHCELEENKRRIKSVQRGTKRKPRDPAMAQRNQEGGAVLMGAGSPNFLGLDVTNLTADEAASEIMNWLKTRRAQ